MIDADEQQGVLQAAVGENWKRLEGVRSRYDPSGLFAR
jgi:hypothetical protein